MVKPNSPTSGSQQDDPCLQSLLDECAPELRPLVERSAGAAALSRDAVDRLKAPPSTAEPSAQDLVSLAERAVELEELEEVVRRRWPRREERTAALRKLLRCGAGSAGALLRALAEEPGGGCALNRRLQEAGHRELRADTARELRAELEVLVRQRLHMGRDGVRPVLVTAPHNIYLHRDGHSPHVMEEYTTLIAQRISRQLQGCCLTWSRAEQRRSELMWFLARREGEDSSVYLDPRNRDPNYLARDEVLSNPWFKHMSCIRMSFEDEQGSGRPALHLDVHGCRDPPSTPSHLTVGLAAMRHEAAAGRGLLGAAAVEAFGSALEEELTLVLGGLSLGRRCEATPHFLVRVLMPTLLDDSSVERLSGAWPPSTRRATQSQQAVAFAGFTHSCQLELSKTLRRALVADEAALNRFAGALYKAWAVSCGTYLPVLPNGRARERDHRATAPRKAPAAAPSSPSRRRQA